MQNPTYRRILVPLDGSPLAEVALPHALELARRFEATLVLLRVLETLPDPREAATWAEQRTAALAHEYMAGIIDRVQQANVPVEVAVITGRPQRDIISYAQSRAIDLIVMTNRGVSGVSRWLTGSVAERVVRGAPCSVLVVRP